jgi:hypothetical protein
MQSAVDGNPEGTGGERRRVRLEKNTTGGGTRIMQLTAGSTEAFPGVDDLEIKPRMAANLDTRLKRVIPMACAFPRLSVRTRCTSQKPPITDPIECRGRINEILSPGLCFG